MYTITTVVALATLAAAAPIMWRRQLSLNTPAVDVCGNTDQLYCCTGADGSANGALGGVLAGLSLNGIADSLFDNCNPISLTPGETLGAIIDAKCQDQTACCQPAGVGNTSFISIPLPCVKATDLLG